MGLDMYAYKVPKKFAKGNFEIDQSWNPSVDGGDNDFCYWRKHYALHEWFYCLYKDKGGKGGSGEFNCIPVRLTLADLNDLEYSIENEELDLDYGWGGEIRESMRDADLDFVKKAREAIKDGYEVYYDSWW